MNGGQATPSVGKRAAGPQGTRLFNSEELSQFADDMRPASSGRASVHEPVLEGVAGHLAGKRFVLRAGRQTIGRRADNDIVLHDLSVSASHAWIMNQQGHYALLNTLSTNGTFVNGNRIHEASLKHGDRVRFGQAEFVFLTREADAGRGWSWRWIAGAAVACVGAGALAWWLA